MRIPEIQPFQFIRGTAFSERVQLANKVNEIIDGINSIGEIPDIQAQVDALSSKVSTIQAGLASTNADLDELTEQVNSLISEVNDTIKTQLTALQGEVSALDSRVDTAETDISGLDSEVQGLLSEVIDSVAMSSTAHGTVQVQINHEDGSNDISQPIDLGLVEQGGITLISGTTDRSFKLHVDLTDGTAWETNDMIIPPGGGTEVTVTGITLHTGTSESYLQASIVLSDATTIDSNDFAIVTTAQFTQLSSRVTTVEGTTAQHTTQISGLDDRVSALEQAGGYVLVPATASVLGGVKIGTGITVASDGTISIPNASSSQNGLMSSADKAYLDAAATAATFMFTADATKVTAHLDSVSGSEFSEDIPQASQGGAGTIDAASYQKIAANESAISELEADVAALAPSVSVNEEADPPTITVGINGKTAQANLPMGKLNKTLTTHPDDEGIPQFEIGDVIQLNNARTNNLSGFNFIGICMFKNTSNSQATFYGSSPNFKSDLTTVNIQHYLTLNLYPNGEGTNTLGYTGRSDNLLSYSSIKLLRFS